MSKIYLASSWRNTYQPVTVESLRVLGHDVYDFRNPPNRSGFAWKQISETELSTPETYLAHINHAIAWRGFASDMDAMKNADIIACLLPCGRSAHWELGWGAGAGKITYVILSEEKFEPELMYLGATRTFPNLEAFLIFMRH